MEGRFSSIYSEKWVKILLLVGFCLILYFVNLGRWDLWNPDEPRYAQVAREMVQRGDWILMHVNGEIYPDKPPFFFWAVALSSFFWGGFTSFSVRFPAALFGTLTVILTFLMGRKLYSYRTGFWSGLILATSFEFAYLSSRANIDTTLTFFTTASFFCFLHWYRTGREERRNLPLYGFYLGMALATLTKGPVGIVLPLLGCLSYLFYLRDWKAIKEMKFFVGLALLLAVVLLWYAPAVMKGGRAYLEMTLFRQTIDRFAKGWSHERPFYYYFYNFPVQFLPWTFFLPGAIVYGLSKERIEKRKEFLFLLTWSVIIFMFFSISKGKRGIYLLPLYPAAALIVGKLWNDFIDGSLDRFSLRWVSWTLYGLTGFIGVVGVVIPLALLMKFPSYLRYGLPVSFLFLVGSLALLRAQRMRRHGMALGVVLGVVAAAFLYLCGVVFPLVNPYKSARYLSQEITSRIQPGEKLGIYGSAPESINFYTGIVPIVELESGYELFGFLRSPQQVWCLIDVRSFEVFQKMRDMPKVLMITERQVGGSSFVLVAN